MPLTKKRHQRKWRKPANNGKGRRAWWVLGLVALLAVVFTTQVFAASITVTTQTLQNTGTDNAITYTQDWSGASAIVTRQESSDLTLVSDEVTSMTVGGTKVSGNVDVTITLKDGAGATLDSGSGTLSSTSGTYNQAITMDGPVVAYYKVATVSVVYSVGSVPVAFDAASSANGNTTSLSWSHTVGSSGTNRIIVVGIETKGATVVSGVTYAGQDLALIGALSNGTSTRTELWYRVAPATGTNSVVVTLPSKTQTVGGATSWTEVHQTTPLGTDVFASGTSTSPTVDVTSASGEAVVDAVAVGGGGSRTVGADQTQRWSLASGGTAGAGSSESGATTVTMSWTLGISNTWATGAVPLKPASP